MGSTSEWYRPAPLGGSAGNAASRVENAFMGTAIGEKGRMGMARQNAVEKLRCQKCKKDGVAKWQDGAEPHNKRKLIGLTAGFKSIDKGGHEGQLIVCAACGSKITST